MRLETVGMSQTGQNGALLVRLGGPGLDVLEVIEEVPATHYARADFTPIAPAVSVLGGGPRNKAQWKRETRGRHGRR